MRQLYGRKLTGKPGSTLCSIALAVGITIVVTAASFASTLVGHAATLKKATHRDVQDDVVTVQKLRFTRPVRIAAPLSYLVRAGDTLSKIAKNVYGSDRSWPSLWWINKAQVKNPNAIRVGQVLKLSAWHPQDGWIYTAAVKAVPVTVQVQTTSFQRNTLAQSSASAHRASSPVYTGSGWPGGAFGNCVVQRESGGNSQVMNGSGHYGLYQFSESTWEAYGGSSADFGHASVGEQERVFMNAMARGGESNWSPYDGC
jgi:LysM repeat protein